MSTAQVRSVGTRVGTYEIRAVPARAASALHRFVAVCASFSVRRYFFFWRERMNSATSKLMITPCPSGLSAGPGSGAGGPGV